MSVHAHYNTFQPHRRNYYNGNSKRKPPYENNFQGNGAPNSGQRLPNNVEKSTGQMGYQWNNQMGYFNPRGRQPFLGNGGNNLGSMQHEHHVRMTNRHQSVTHQNQYIPV